jgi:Tfp pilus assembly protein PilX
MYVALVVMVLMMLAGVAVLRAVVSGQGVAGNLSFKQNATSAADRGVVAAMGFLAPALAASAPSTATLGVDLPAQAYFAEWGPSATSAPDPLCYAPAVAPALYPTFDPATFLWDTCPSVQQATADDGTHNKVRYIIHRLCSMPGPLDPPPPSPPNDCVSVIDDTTLGTAGGGTSYTGIASPPPPPYFRVTTRVDGPRNTVSYTQVVVK